jgi:hypothetical protein
MLSAILTFREDHVNKPNVSRSNVNTNAFIAPNTKTNEEKNKRKAFMVRTSTEI